MQRLYFTLFACLFFLCSYAQKDSARTKITFVSLSAGLNFSPSANVDADQIRKLAKDHSGNLLNENLSPYFKQSVIFSGQSIFTAAIGVGLNVWNKKAGLFRKSSLRFSLRYAEYQPMSSYYTVDTNFYAGTYSNSNSNFQSFPVYEVKSHIYSINYYLKTLQAEVSQYFHTNEARRISVYAGYSLSVGASLRSTVYVSKSNEDRYSTVYKQGQSIHSAHVSYSQFINADYSYEDAKAHTSFIAGVGVPLGIQCRVSKKKKGLGHFLIGLEVEPKMNAIIIQQGGTRWIPSLYTTPVIKYRL